MLWVILVIAILIIFYFLIIKSKKNEQLGYRQNVFEELERVGFITDKEIPLHFGDSYLVVDDHNKRWSYFNVKEPMPVLRSFDCITGYEIYEDGNSVAKGKAGQALVGGLLFGVAGAVVAGSGSKKQKNTCTSLQVRITLNDLHRPEIVIPLLENTEIPKDSPGYRGGIETAKEIVAVLSYMVNNSERINSQN